jgi:hypothetical protein
VGRAVWRGVRSGFARRVGRNRRWRNVVGGMAGCCGGVGFAVW